MSPLMFLVLFGGIFNFAQSDKLELVVPGEVPLVERMNKGASRAFEESFDVRRAEDRVAALADVRTGDADAALEMGGQSMVVHYSATDQVKAAIVRGTLQSFVDAANVAVSGEPPTFTMDAQRVEDESLMTIQFVTPVCSAGPSR